MRRHSLATPQTVTKPAFTRDSIQRWPTGSGISGETICFNQCRASAFLLDTVAFYSTSCLGQADPAWLGCRRPHGPGRGIESLGVLTWAHVHVHISATYESRVTLDVLLMLMICGHAYGILRGSWKDGAKHLWSWCNRGSATGLWILMDTSTLADTGAYRQAIST